MKSRRRARDRLTTLVEWSQRGGKVTRPRPAAFTPELRAFCDAELGQYRRQLPEGRTPCRRGGFPGALMPRTCFANGPRCAVAADPPAGQKFPSEPFLRSSMICTASTVSSSSVAVFVAPVL